MFVAGSGLVASYDPVGTPEFFDYVIQGSAENLVHPFLHNQVRFCFTGAITR